jgi:hypothetical protein
MVLPVHRDPFLRRQTCRQPQDQLEQEDDRRVELQRFMRGGAVQVNRRAEHGDLRDGGRGEKTDGERNQHEQPPTHELPMSGVMVARHCYSQRYEMKRFVVFL